MHQGNGSDDDSRFEGNDFNELVEREYLFPGNQGHGAITDIHQVITQ